MPPPRLPSSSLVFCLQLLLAVLCHLSLLPLASSQDDDLVCFVPGDCEGVVLDVDSTNTSEECLEFCQNVTDCEWFTWDPPDEGEDVYRCYAQSNCPSLDDSDCSDCVSGQVECEPPPVEGNTSNCTLQEGTCANGTQVGLAPATSVDECLDACRESGDECVAFSFSESDSACYLFSSCPSVEVDEGSECGADCVTAFEEDCQLCSAEGACGDGSSIVGTEDRAENEAECWDLCQLTDGCAYFTYFATDGTCLLFSTCNFEADDSGEVLTSEADCPRPEEEPEHCFVQGQCVGTLISAVITDTAEECLEYCQDDVTDCNWFTFNPAGSSSESDRCDAYFDCPDLDESCLDCVSGEACDCDCGQLPDDEHALTKFLIGLGRDTLYDVEVADLPSAYEDSSSDDHTVCEKPTDYPLFLETAVAALLEERVTFCGGGFGGDETYRDCYQLEPDTNGWDYFGHMELDRAFAASVMVPLHGWWVLGGFDEIEFGVHVTTEMYNQDSEGWSYGPNLPEPLYGLCAVQVDDGRTVIVGGNSDDDEVALRRTYVYDWTVDDDTFEELPSMTLGREAPACGVYNYTGGSYVVVAGGIVDEFGSETSTTELLFLEDGGSAPTAWTEAPDLPFAVTGATMLRDGDDLILVGGDDNPNVVRFVGPDSGWEIVEGLELVRGDRLFAPALAVPDAALNGCV